MINIVDKKSCLSNLLESVDAVIDLLESGCPVDVFYFDFCKAFDSVPHYRLLTKLENYGIKGSTLAIIKDFLSGISLRSVLSGVPQGPTSETRHLARAWEEIFFGRKKREEKEEIFVTFSKDFFWNKDKLIEEIFEENVSIKIKEEHLSVLEHSEIF